MNERPNGSEIRNNPVPTGGGAKIEYTLKEGIFALISLVLAYFISDTLGKNSGLGVTVAVFAFAAFVTAYLIITKKKTALRSVVVLALLLVTSLVFVLFDNYELKSCTLLFDMVLGMYWMFTSLGGSTSERFDYLALFDALKAVVILPVSCFVRIFPAIFSGLSGKKGDRGKSTNRRPLYIFLGIVAAIVPSAIVLSELANDTAFYSFIENLLNMRNERLSEIMTTALFAVPIGCYLFGGLFGATRLPKKHIMTYESTHREAEKLRILPLLMVCTAITPLLIIYLLYFFSQMPYFLSGFMNVRPEEYTFAEYARSGFFELCKVSVVNLIVIGVAEMFSKRNGKKPLSLKIYISIFSVFTLALMAIAQSKLILYIRAYGMTPLRVMTFWFTLVLGAVFVFILLYQFLPKINFTRCVATALAVLFCALIFSDTDAMIARYNIGQYKSGEVYMLDTDLLLYQLSDSADAVILDEIDSLPAGKTKADLTNYMKKKTEKAEEQSGTTDWGDWNLASYLAEKKLVDKYGSGAR